MRRSAFRLACLAALGCGSMGVGCGLDSLLNPEFLVALGLGDTTAVVPGEAPVLVLEVENKSGRPVEARLTWRSGDTNTISERDVALSDGEKYSEVVVCPIPEVTLGEVGDTSAIGAIVRLGAGLADDPYIEVEPFGRILEQEVNYDCGDAVTFTILPSAQTLSGYQVFAFIRRGGAQ